MTKVTLVGESELSITVDDYWERSVNGFGVYSKEVSKSIFQKHIRNNSNSMSNWAYNVEFRKIGESFFLLIKK
jgi:hypothetical protein